MSTVRICSDSNCDVNCPKRGLIDVEWCFGCANRLQSGWDGTQTVIYCDPGSFASYHQATWGPLHDVPDDLGS
jgi:hypothetical protein